MSDHALLVPLSLAHDRVAAIGHAIDTAQADAALRAAIPTLDLRVDRHELNARAASIAELIRAATRPFTLAVIGEFKVGKSTLLNALLGLSEADALSAQDDPDTARSIVLRHRHDGDPEARLRFVDGTTEDATRVRARQLSSQVHLTAHPEDVAFAAKVVEIEMLFASAVLDRVLLNDLPGTGSRHGKAHDDIAHQRAREADAVLWVVGMDEPSADARDDLERLARAGRKVIPILNVWWDPASGVPRQDERADAVASALVSRFSHHFVDWCPEPIRISARVLETERRRPTPDAASLAEAGAERIADALLQATSRPIARTAALARTAITVITEVMELVEPARRHADAHRATLDAQAAREGSAVVEVQQAHDQIVAQIGDLARLAGQEVAQHVAGLAELFVDDTLQLGNLGDLGRSVANPKALELSLKARFLEQYLRLGEEPNWFDVRAQRFAEDARHVAVAELLRVGERTASHGNAKASGAKRPSLRFDALTDAFRASLAPLLAKGGGFVVLGGLLLAIPGGAVVDAIGLIGLAAASLFVDPLAGYRKRAIERMRRQMEAERHVIAADFQGIGVKAAAGVESAVLDELTSRVEGVTDSADALRTLRDALDTGFEELRASQRTLRELTEVS